jgi:hypothetical protein
MRLSMHTVEVVDGSALHGKSLFVWDYVVADAVAVEPVSASHFPANREINREFFRSDQCTRPMLPIHAMISLA